MYGSIDKKIIFSGLAVLALTVVGCDRSNNEPDPVPEPDPINLDEVVPVYPVAREGWDIYTGDATGRRHGHLCNALIIRHCLF